MDVSKEALENAIGAYRSLEEIEPLNLLDLVAVQAMQELLEYRTIGTVEEVKYLKYGALKYRECKGCKTLFIATHGNRKYCPACEYADKLNPTARRKKNEARYLHKVITDYINNILAEDSEPFRNESNYYWAIIQGRKPKTAREHWYTSAVKTEEDYLNWLKQKKEDLKAQKVFGNERGYKCQEKENIKI